MDFWRQTQVDLRDEANIYFLSCGNEEYFDGMNQSKTGPGVRQSAMLQFGLVALCLLVLLGFLFRDGLRPGRTVFSNDGPLGAISSECTRSPEGFFGFWQDLNWLGGTGPSSPPDISQMLPLVFGKLIFSKIYAPFALLFLGLSAWLCFRQWKLSPTACILGGLAAALNSGFFSTACWGVASQPLSFGLDFLALAALADETSPKRWVRVALAGFAVGLGVMEAFDIGAIFSVVVAAFVVFQALAGEGTTPKRVGGGIARLSLVAGCAAFIAASAVSGLVGTQIKGVANMGQDAASKARRWNEATQWSLPKCEALNLIVPGLFGYRMDTPQGLPEGLQESYRGGNYWGACGRDAAWDSYFAGLAGGPLQEGQMLRIAFAASPNLDTTRQINGDGKIVLPGVGEFKAAGRTTNDLEQEIKKSRPQLASQGVTITLERPGGFIRYGGGGPYAGVLVVLVALWTVFQSFRKQHSVFGVAERKFIWFWSGVALLCALVGFGRFAPFYQLFYALPFASTMRNPCKFFHVVEWALVILFAYGVHGLSRYCLEAPVVTVRGPGSQRQTWWAKATTFDKNWVKGSVVALGASLVAWLIYSDSRHRLAAYLQEVDFDSIMADAIAGFSIRQAGWFVVLLALALGLVALLAGGFFSGRRARVGAILLGLLLVGDLGWANVPWVITWNWVRKYATNPVIDFLREKPYEHRVAVLPFHAPPQLALFSELYDIEWKQQLFQYYNIQSLDVVMMPRAPVDYIAFESALFFDGTTNTLHHVTRRWELTNTRYLLGAAGFLDVLNQQIDPLQHRFRIAARFDIAAKPGIPNPIGLDELTAVIKPDGQYAVFDFTGALPRAKLYANWQVNTNDEAAVKELASAEFNPDQTVLVADPLPAPGSASATNQNAGTVEFTSYAPKRIVLQTKAGVPSVLLLNDRFDPNWKVSVDGKPERLLRCNYLMRGVPVPPGEHVVEFRFAPPINTLYVSLTAVALGLGLCGFLALYPWKKPAVTEAGKPAPLAGSPANK
jgi:hypothetical protein